MSRQRPVEGALVEITTASAAGDISGMEIEAAADRGFEVSQINVNTAGLYRITIDAASVFDQNVADIAYITVTGQVNDPGATVRRGQDSNGVVIAAGSFVLRATTNSFIPAFYVPKGMFLTVRHVTPATASVIGVAFETRL